MTKKQVLEKMSKDKQMRNFLFEYLINERKLSDRSVNYYNSIIRFMYEVTMDKLINKK